MLCVWPETVHESHWLDGVRFECAVENFVMKNIMLDVMNRVFVNLSRKPEVGLIELSVRVFLVFTIFTKSITVVHDCNRKCISSFRG